MQHPRLGAVLELDVRDEGSHRHTEGLPGSQCSSPRKAPFSQSLIGSVGNCRVYHQHQAGLQSSPQPSPTVFAGYNLSRGIQETLSVPFGLRLLPCGDYRDWYGEQLGNSSSQGPQCQFSRRTERLWCSLC